MRAFRKPLLWLWLLTKRLYKKPTFLIILVLIPLLVFGYSSIAKGDSGMITIALYGQDDPLTQSVFKSLKSGGQLLQYTHCASAEEAQTLVWAGKVDAAWIFPEDLSSSIDAFIADPDPEHAFLQVIQREENVALMLARERLSGTVYTPLARSYFVRYIRDTFPEMDTLTDEQLLAYYDGTGLTDELFAYDDVHAQQKQQVHYLMSPIRGLLAIVIVLGSMATAMYFIQDRQLGTFNWVPQRLQALPELGCQLVALFNICTAALITLLLIGMAANLFWEIFVLVLFTVCTAVFGMLLRRLLGSIRGIGTAMPLLIVIMLLVCPVFFDLGALRKVQYLLPPTYYIHAVYNKLYILYMVFYTAACGFLYWLIGKLFRRS